MLPATLPYSEYSQHFTHTNYNEHLYFKCNHCPQDWTITKGIFEQAKYSTSQYSSHIKSIHMAQVIGSFERSNSAQAIKVLVSKDKSSLLLSTNTAQPLFWRALGQMLLLKALPFSFFDTDAVQRAFEFALQIKCDGVQ